jgi:hypothetical protein
MWLLAASLGCQEALTRMMMMTWQASEPLLLDALAPLDRNLKGPRLAPLFVALGVIGAAVVVLSFLCAHLGLDVEGRQVQHDMRKPHLAPPSASASPAHAIYRYRGSHR